MNLASCIETPNPTLFVLKETVYETGTVFDLGVNYAILIPEKKHPECEDAGEGEALVFKVVEQKGDAADFTLVTEGEIVEAVFKKYHQLLAKQR